MLAVGLPHRAACWVGKVPQSATGLGVSAEAPREVGGQCIDEDIANGVIGFL